MPDKPPRNIVESFFLSVMNILDGPTTWVRGQLVS